MSDKGNLPVRGELSCRDFADIMKQGRPADGALRFGVYHHLFCMGPHIFVADAFAKPDDGLYLRQNLLHYATAHKNIESPVRSGRHQKLIEFSPADISDKMRKDMEEAAVNLAKSVGYQNAGTVEFLVDGDEFYFMEVNTRIQVEHRVTEVRYGIDIVEEQLRIAAGEKLRYNQSDLKPKGFSLECRINAEDPKKDFEPCPGRVKKFRKPVGENIIVDSHLSTGYKIPHRYDSLIANLITYGDDKEQAVKTMKGALKDFRIRGDNLKTTIPYHLLRLKDF